MKITPSTLTIRPAQTLPSPPPVQAAPAAAELGTLAALGTIALTGAAVPAPDDLFRQVGEGIASVLDAAGEKDGWPCAVSGSGIGLILGGLHFAEASKHGDRTGMQEGLRKITASGIGIVTGLGVFHAYPTLQTGLEFARTVLGSTTPTVTPDAFTSYGRLAMRAPRR